jgi:hypothetical protein
MEGDRAHGCVTLPIRFGVARAARMIAPFFVVPWLLIPLMAWLPDPGHSTATLLTGNQTFLTLLGLALAAWGAYAARLLLANPEDSRARRTILAWTHLFMIAVARRSDSRSLRLLNAAKKCVSRRQAQCYNDRAPRRSPGDSLADLPEPEGYRVRWSALADVRRGTLNALVAQLVERIRLEGSEDPVAPGRAGPRSSYTGSAFPSAKGDPLATAPEGWILAFVLEKVQALSFIPIPDQL